MLYNFIFENYNMYLPHNNNPDSTTHTCTRNEKRKRTILLDVVYMNFPPHFMTIHAILSFDQLQSK